MGKNGGEEWIEEEWIVDREESFNSRFIAGLWQVNHSTFCEQPNLIRS